MLSAQQRKMPDDAAPENSPSPASGFGKVLGSIHGLQQRLDDFSVEEVSRAHAKATDLIRGLGQLQGHLSALAKLKNALVEASASIGSRPEVDFDVIDPDNLERHPQLRAIVQTGKLIRMHRLLKAAQASAESVSFEFPNPGTKQINMPDVASAPSIIALPHVFHRSEESLPIPSENDVDANNSAADEALVVPQEAVNFANPQSERSQTKSRYDFADLKLEEASAIGQRRHLAPAQADSSGAVEKKGKEPSENTYFDQRLLSDLIDSYGEFAFSTKPAADTAAPQTNPKQDVFRESTVAPEIDAKPGPAPSLNLDPAELAQQEAAPAGITPAEPAFVEPIAGGLLALPAAEEEISTPVFEQSLPNAKARGEIDRQLKNIIKDYGAVDLYSHRQSLNTRTTAIAAAAVLALLLGGIYFFKASSSNPPAPVEAGVSEPTATDAKSKNPARKN
jgi:hypothetical protein